MDIKGTTSVSKGCFLFKNGPNRLNRKRKNSVFDDSESGLWYPPYKSVKNFTNAEIEAIQSSTFTKVKDNLRQFVGNCSNKSDSWNLNNLPTAVLLTGVNQGDHYQFFDSFTNEIRDNASVAVIQGRNCLNLKSAIYTMVFSLIGQHHPGDDEEAFQYHSNMRRSQYNTQVLRSWYNETFGSNGHTLIIVIPDFELFRKEVLIKFMQSLLTINGDIPIVLVLGVATDISMLQRILPFHIINKLQLCVFQSSPSKQCLEKMLNNVILSPKVCVNLSGNMLNFLTDIFLYFDFSINSFLKGYQYCVMEHYYQGNAFSLCTTTFEQSVDAIKKLKHEDIEQIRQLPSFRAYVESLNDPSKIINLLENDKYFLQNLEPLLKNVYKFFSKFHCFLRLLFTMVQNLPKNYIGKQLRDVYALCGSTNIFKTEQFSELWQLLTMLSKEEFLQTINNSINTLNQYKETFCCDDDIGIETRNLIDEIVDKLTDCTSKLSNADSTENPKSETPIKLSKDYKEELKMRMKEQASNSKLSTDLRNQMNVTLSYIKKELSKYLIPFNKGPTLYELFVFDDVKSVRQHIMGAPRAAVHTALQNPQLYLQCTCCTLDDPTQVISTLPDISVAFKLHLESGRMINLFDWLQAFNIIHLPNPDDESDEIQPEIQARFVRAVAELQFLGYIKSSKRKTDHVARLTW